MCEVGIKLGGRLDSGIKVVNGLIGIWRLTRASSGNVVDTGLIFLSTRLYAVKLCAIMPSSVPKLFGISRASTSFAMSSSVAEPGSMFINLKLMSKLLLGSLDGEEPNSK